MLHSNNFHSIVWILVTQINQINRFWVSESSFYRAAWNADTV